MKTKLSLFILALLLFACKKDELCTNESYCAEIDGKKWSPVDDGDPQTGGSLIVHLMHGNNLWIRATNQLDSSIVFFGIVDSVNLIREGSYVLNGKGGDLPDGLRNGGFYLSASGEEFMTDSTYTGLVTVTNIDKVKGRISGNFYFKARNPITGKIADISNGSFNTFYWKY
ncbi:hypothetical protein K3G39_05020 [Pontibacter sp. HSC-14F20]|uniref:DUF6252 family protein n=1 Tax=Pontibacter sp. HSC-14F20 TaxID=2864136 RepID=UPI001C731A13|nr:DUF6252 family protein [Pontibacter sp. HSC-14F20]MBX0332592.1 hypothetical protein [Pontibacter sp. HSC-14F20]